MATTVTVSGNGTSGPYSVSAIDWHPYGLLQQQSIVFRLDPSQNATLLTYGDDYIFNQEEQSITLVGDTLSFLESLTITRETPDTFFASLPDLGVADAISAKSNDLQVMNRLNEVEADLARVSGEVSLTFEGEAFTSVSAGSNVNMAITNGDLTISSTGGGGGGGGGGGFTDATFGYGKPNQSSGISTFLELTHATTGFYGSVELDEYVNQQELTNEEFVNTAIDSAVAGPVANNINAALAPYAVKSVSNSDGKIGVTNTSGAVELSYTGPDPVATPTGSMTMWCGSSAALPDGWALCDGSAVDSTSDTSFADLFDVIGTAFGGSGAASFNLPDMRGNVPVGVNGLSPELGGTGGESTVRLTQSQMPRHEHRLTGTLTFITSVTPEMSTEQGSADTTVRTISTTSGSINSTTTHTGGTGTGSTDQNGAAHNNMQPYVGVHYIIKK